MRAGARLSELGVYRKIHVKIWTSADFLALDPPKPNPRVLFFHLLTGPHATAIPGLFSSGPAALAEAIGWPIAAWKRCFSSIEARGMVVADWTARLVYLPGALAHNRPANPNVVHGWRNAWILLPSCDLKSRVEAEIGATMTGAFAEAWAHVTRGASRKVPGAFVPEQSTERSVEATGQSSSKGSLCARSGAQAAPAPAPAPVPVPVPASGLEGVQGEPLPDDLDAALRILWARCVETATAAPAPAIAHWPEELETLHALWRDAGRAGVPWPGFQPWLTSEHVRPWIDATRAKGGGAVKLTRGWRPSAMVTWMSERDADDAGSTSDPTDDDIARGFRIDP